MHEVKPGGKGGKYGNAYGFYYRNGIRADAVDNDPEHSWCHKDDTIPQEIPCAACGSWVLLDILGEPTTDPIKVYGINDVLEIRATPREACRSFHLRKTLIMKMLIRIKQASLLLMGSKIMSIFAVMKIIHHQNLKI